MTDQLTTTLADRVRQGEGRRQLGTDVSIGVAAVSQPQSCGGNDTVEIQTRLGDRSRLVEEG